MRPQEVAAGVVVPEVWPQPVCIGCAGVESAWGLQSRGLGLDKRSRGDQPEVRAPLPADCCPTQFLRPALAFPVHWIVGWSDEKGLFDDWICLHAMPTGTCLVGSGHVHGSVTDVFGDAAIRAQNFQKVPPCRVLVSFRCEETILVCRIREDARVDMAIAVGHLSACRLGCEAYGKALRLLVVGKKGGVPIGGRSRLCQSRGYA